MNDWNGGSGARRSYGDRQGKMTADAAAAKVYVCCDNGRDRSVMPSVSEPATTRLAANKYAPSNRFLHGKVRFRGIIRLELSADVVGDI